MMPFLLENVLIWGRSFDEYKKMFDIQEKDLNKKILGCADGAASFNATASKQGLKITSCDPLYEKDLDEIEQKIKESCDILYPKIVAELSDFNWNYFNNPECLKEYRLLQAQTFLDDFSVEDEKSRYIRGELPNLPFENDSFDLALCGNFLFLYSEILSTEFHKQAIIELCRVAQEVRIFPIIGNDRKLSQHLDAVLKMLADKTIRFEIKVVDYHFSKGAYQMLRIFKDY